MRVHSFESLAAADGEGIRLCVFLAGCPLRCVYCHNPDTWDAAAAREFSPAEIAAKALRYRPYFGNGRGGVTFSGGEPLLQAREIGETEELLHVENISTCIDTSGVVPPDGDAARALRGASLVICDLKFHTEESFKKYTGGSLAAVLDTLAFLDENKINTWVRTVIVPGLNDSESDIAAYAALLSPYSCVGSWRLLTFHTMGFEKYERLGIVNPLAGVAAADAAKVGTLQKYADALRA